MRVFFFVIGKIKSFMFVLRNLADALCIIYLCFATSSASESGPSSSTSMSMRSTISLNRTPADADGGGGGGEGGIESFSNFRFRRAIRARDSSDCRESSAVSVQDTYVIIEDGAY